MKLYKIDIKPHGVFYTSIKGDMFFGMFCCAVADCLGNERLNVCLSGYEENKPFIVFSDAFPKGFLPKPMLPAQYYKTGNKDEFDANKRKEIKRKNWLPIESLNLPTFQMQNKFEEIKFKQSFLKTANRIEQKTNHASGGVYSAYTTEPIMYNTPLSIYMSVDESKISLEEIELIIKNIGMNGFGKKSSSGGGKFEVCGNIEEVKLQNYKYNKFMTLGPCVPQSKILNADECFYKIFVRFGRHGSKNALSENPFKKPVITMDTGTVLTFTTEPENVLFTGKGVKGTSLIDDDVVYQGYALLVPILAEEFAE